MAKGFFDNVSGKQKLTLIFGGFILLVVALAIFPDEAASIMTFIVQLPAAFDAFLSSSTFYKNPTHRLSRRPEKMRTAFPSPCSIRIHQPDVGLMHQRRGLKSVIRRFLSHLLRRQPP